MAQSLCRNRTELRPGRLPLDLQFLTASVFKHRHTDGVGTRFQVHTTGDAFGSVDAPIVHDHFPIHLQPGPIVRSQSKRPVTGLGDLQGAAEA